MDILISLNKDMQIDLSVFIDCEYKKYNLSLAEYAYLCSRLVNFDSLKIKTQIVDILDKQIKNESNQDFIDRLISTISYELANEDTFHTNDGDFFIKPSQVFIKNIHEHK